MIALLAAAALGHAVGFDLARVAHDTRRVDDDR